MIDGGLRQIFRKNLPSIHWVSIESGMTGLGIPDSNGCLDGVEFWLEYKKTDGWKVKVRPEQCGWHLRRQRSGGKSFFAVRRKQKTIDELWIVHGSLAKELLEFGLQNIERRTNQQVFFGSGGPTKWEWEAVRRTLLTR